MPFVYRQPDGSQIPIPSWEEFEALKASVEDLRGRLAAFDMANVSRNQRGPTAEELGQPATGSFHAAPEMGQQTASGPVAGGLPQQIAAAPVATGLAGASPVHPTPPPAIAQPATPGQPVR